ncbi:hypothetical protein [Virgisporangium aliadipatigenens]|nr:hypothetical protein [Virgisporangium aliadipatigenens]
MVPAETTARPEAAAPPWTITWRTDNAPSDPAARSDADTRSDAQAAPDAHAHVASEAYRASEAHTARDSYAAPDPVASGPVVPTGAVLDPAAPSDAPVRPAAHGSDTAHEGVRSRVDDAGDVTPEADRTEASPGSQPEGAAVRPVPTIPALAEDAPTNRGGVTYGGRSRGAVSRDDTPQVGEPHAPGSVGRGAETPLADRDGGSSRADRPGSREPLPFYIPPRVLLGTTGAATDTPSGSGAVPTTPADPPASVSGSASAGRPVPVEAASRVTDEAVDAASMSGDAPGSARSAREVPPAAGFAETPSRGGHSAPPPVPTAMPEAAPPPPASAVPHTAPPTTAAPQAMPPANAAARPTPPAITAPQTALPASAASPETAPITGGPHETPLAPPIAASETAPSSASAGSPRRHGTVSAPVGDLQATDVPEHAVDAVAVDESATAPGVAASDGSPEAGERRRADTPAPEADASPEADDTRTDTTPAVDTGPAAAGPTAEATPSEVDSLSSEVDDPARVSDMDSPQRTVEPKSVAGGEATGGPPFDAWAEVESDRPVFRSFAVDRDVTERDSDAPAAAAPVIPLQRRPPDVESIRRSRPDDPRRNGVPGSPDTIAPFTDGSPSANRPTADGRTSAERAAADERMPADSRATHREGSATERSGAAETSGAAESSGAAAPDGASAPSRAAKRDGGAERSVDVREEGGADTAGGDVRSVLAPPSRRIGPGTGRPNHPGATRPAAGAGAADRTAPPAGGAGDRTRPRKHVPAHSASRRARVGRRKGLWRLLLTLLLIGFIAGASVAVFAFVTAAPSGAPDPSERPSAPIRLGR